jgi:hypothetical protein
MTGVCFADAPAKGTKVVLDDQLYLLDRVEPYVRKSGTHSSLLTWLTVCPNCSVAFEVKTGLATKSLNRRCEKCRRPHATVSGKSRKARVNVQVVPV